MEILGTATAVCVMQLGKKDILNSLPVEISRNIFSMLDKKSLKAAISSDAGWKKIIDNDRLLQKKIKEDSLMTVRLTILKRKNLDQNDYNENRIKKYYTICF